MKLIRIINRYQIYILLISFTLLYSFISVHKHIHFQSFAWDLAFFDELIWKVSRGIEQRSSLVDLHILGDHWQPVILIFAPFYWLWNDVRILLIGQSIIAAVSAYPIYLLAKKVLNKTTALVITVSFLLFTGYQHAVLDGFHQSVFAAFFTGWLYYFLETKNKLGYWLSIFGLLLTKEEYALVVVAIGIVTFWYYKQRLTGILTIIIGVISFFAMIYVLIPFFQQGPYTHFNYGAVGNTPIDVINTSITNPLLFINQLVQPIEKLKTVWSTFLSFGFFSIFSPIHLIPIVQQFIVRFIDDITVHRWTNLNHYSFPLSPLMAIATIYGVKKIRSFFPQLSLSKITYIILFFTGFQNFFYHGPVNSTFKPSFCHTQSWEYDAHALIRQVPPMVAVASQNSLLPHLSQRQKYFLLLEIGNAEHIAVDLADGPNKYSPIDHKRTLSLIHQLIDTGRYHIIWQSGESYLLKIK